MSLTKASLSKRISKKYGFTSKKSSEIIEDSIEIMKQQLARGENVLISGFGKFNVREKSARRGRNPSKGRELNLGPRRVVTFSCSPKLKKTLNDP